MTDPPTTRTARSPAQRPTWLVVLSVLTLALGGLLLFSGLNTLRHPGAGGHLGDSIGKESLTPAQEDAAKEVVEVTRTLMEAHGATVRGLAIGSLGLALLMLYAAAATLSLDRHGRAITLCAATAGIVYQVTSAVLSYPIASEYAEATRPAMLKLFAASATATQAGSASPDVAVAVAKTLIVALPIVLAALAIGYSLLLIAYFGGRRGRELYGLELPPE